jgi:Low molecular weight phosphotyrosine protein phosphatase
VEYSYEQIGDRPTVGPNFLPVIIERFAREQLWALAQADGRIEKPLPEVLFVREHNAGRSQIAACLAHHLSNGWVAVRSAGSHPDERIDPVAVQAMAEIGLDVSAEFPKPLTDAVVHAAMWWSRWGAAMHARCIPASATRTGPSPIPPASRSRSSDAFARTSITTCGR